MARRSSLGRRLLRQRMAVVGMAVLALMLVGAAFAPLIAPYDPEAMDIIHRLSPPAAAHWFGTDDFGRDEFSRVLFGARLSMITGTLVVVFATVAGTVLGLLSSTLRWLDDLLMRFSDALMAFPDILLAIALMAALGPSLLDVVLALGTVYTPRVARLVRGAALVLQRTQFVEAAAALGAGELRIVCAHLLPNTFAVLIVQATFTFAAAVLTEAALSFLGAGIPPPTPSWGNMIAEGQQYLDRADWLIMAPGLAILLTVLALQLVGDGLRDALDPRLRGLT
jgi:peptide/nickel transport system permease protein